MNDKEPTFDRHDQVLMGLAMNLQATVMVQMGKMANPVTGQPERDLEAARFSIDILEALKVKCRGNLAPDVAQLLDRMVMDLQLNYTDEAARGEGEPAEETAGEPSDDGPADEETESDA